MSPTSYLNASLCPASPVWLAGAKALISQRLFMGADAVAVLARCHHRVCSLQAT